MAKLAKGSRIVPVKLYPRFNVIQRLQHFTFLVSFTLLGLTGLPQKYPLSPISLGIFQLLGGIETARLIHHISAIVMIGVSGIHIIEVGYRLWVDRIHISMIPWTNDLMHVIHDVQYYFGYKKRKAYYGRYSYAEKAEYLALIWGTLVMAATGLMMWNPITTLKFLPGEAIPAAKAAHGGEAVLAVGAIIIWHFYHVHIKTLNKSMFTGKLNREEMIHEHPAELALLDKGEQRPPEVSIRTKVIRQLVFIPFAVSVFAVTALSLYYIVWFEKTATELAPVGETVTAFSPLPTATPVVFQPTPMPRPADLSWAGFVSPMLAEKCGACHGEDGAGGLNILTKASTVQGGSSGTGFVAGDPNGSYTLLLQQAGDHPGQLSPDEIKYLTEWVNAGLP